MQHSIVIANPAGNITVFVLDPPAGNEAHKKLAAAILACPALGSGGQLALKAEQVGFVYDMDKDIPRLVMMGGEFCGNAARSFALFIARERGLSGKGSLQISISGAARPLTAAYDLGEGSASVEIDIPAERRLSCNDYLLYEFPGITHIIAADGFASASRFNEIRAAFEVEIEADSRPLPDALGLMFYDIERAFLRPAVYVYGTDSLVFESSCGSGSAALGVFLSKAQADGNAVHNIAQPGGTIEVVAAKRGGKLLSLSIGGKVSFAKDSRGAEKFLFIEALSKLQF